MQIRRRSNDATSPGQSYSYLEENIQKLEDEIDEINQSAFQKRTLLNNKISENTLQIVSHQKNIDDLKEHDLQREKALSLLQFNVNQARVLSKLLLFTETLFFQNFKIYGGTPIFNFYKFLNSKKDPLVDGGQLAQVPKSYNFA